MAYYESRPLLSTCEFINAVPLIYRLDSSQKDGPSTLVRGDTLEVLKLNVFRKVVAQLNADMNSSFDEKDIPPGGKNRGYVITSGTPSPAPAPWYSEFHEVIRHSNAPFKKRKEAGEIVMSPYSRCHIEVSSDPVLKPVIDSFDGYRRTDTLGLGIFPGFVVSGRFFIDGIHWVPNYSYFDIQFERYWYTVSWSPTLSIGAQEIHDAIRQQSVVDCATVTGCLSESNKGTIDALTALAELPETVHSVLSGFKVIAQLINDARAKEVAVSASFYKRRQQITKRFNDDLNKVILEREGLGRPGTNSFKKKSVALRRKQRNLERSYKRALKQTGIELADAISNVWMNFRYNIMPVKYTVDDLVKTLKSIGVQFLRSATYRYSTIDFSALGLPVKRDIKDTCTIRRSIDANFGAFGGSYSVVGANAALTAWELVKRSWVVDWFINVGDWLSAFTVPNSYTSQMCSYAFKVDLNFDYTDPITHANVRVKGFSYHRLIINPFTYASLVLQPNLNVKRYLDSLSLMWQALRSDLIRAARR